MISLHFNNTFHRFFIIKSYSRREIDSKHGFGIDRQNDIFISFTALGQYNRFDNFINILILIHGWQFSRRMRFIEDRFEG